MKAYRPIVYFLLVLTTVLALIAPIRRATAANEIVSAWLTTADGGSQLARQADVNFAPDTSYNPLTINVDENQTYQQIDGFGASLTDTSAWLLGVKLGSAERDSVMRSLFDPVTGIGISFLRQPIGASDFTHDATPYSYDDMLRGQSDPQLAHFTISHDITYVIPLLQQAIQLNPAIKIMATPWSPPGWMKANGLMTDANNSGYLLPSSYGPLASYFVKFIQAYEAQGIPIYAITPQNEPGFGAPDYPGMHLSVDDEANFIENYLGPALNSAGLHPKILGYDFTWGSGIATNYYPFTLMSDPAAAYLAGTAFHCYYGDPDAMTEMHYDYPQKDVYETECSDAAYPPQCVAGSAPPHPPIETVINAMRNWAKAAVLWNIALDENYGPKQGSQCVGALGLVTADQSTGNGSYTSDYYQLGQVSKFVRPGAYRIGSNTFGPGWPNTTSTSFSGGWYHSGSIEDVAFKNPDRSKVLVVYNTASSDQTFKVHWGSEAFNYTLPAGAIITFTWSGVQGPTTLVSPSPPIYYAVDSGGSGSGAFMPDSYFNAGRTYATTAAIDTSGASSPAPTSVYQTQRLSMIPWSYTFPGLQAGHSYGVRLHFAELWDTAPRQRQFNVSINGGQVLTNFDIYAEAGAIDRAIIEEFVTTADNQGNITIQFSPGAADAPVSNGVEIVDPGLLRPSPTPQATSTATVHPTAQPTNTLAPTSTSVPSATPIPRSTGTTPSQLPPTAIPSQTPIDVPAPSSTATMMTPAATPMPTSTYTVAPIARPTAPTHRPESQCRRDPVTIQSTRLNAASRQVAVAVHVNDARRTPMSIVAQLDRIVETVSGRRRHRKVRRKQVVLYQTTVRAVAVNKQLVMAIHLSFAAHSTVHGLLLLTVHVSCGNARSSMRVVIYPPPTRRPAHKRSTSSPSKRRDSHARSHRPPEHRSGARQP